MGKQLDLFDYLEQIEKASICVKDYYNEFQFLGHMRRSEAGYAGDGRAESQVRELIRKGDEFYRQYSQKQISDLVYQEHLHEILIRLWCVKVKGQVTNYIYARPASPKIYSPVFDENLISRIPPELKLPKEDNLLINYEYRPSPEGNGHSVLFCQRKDGRWYTAIAFLDLHKGKWTDTRMIRHYGARFRADLENQWWTREGFQLAMDTGRLDLQIAAVSTNYLKFFGRDEALKRLGLPSVN